MLKLPKVEGAKAYGRQVMDEMVGAVWTFRTDEEAQSYAALLTHRQGMK